jgi:hypothetical protein
MSGPARPVGEGVSMAAGRYASQGMIGPAQFVQPNGDLTAVSFRFLNSLFRSIQDLQGQVTTLQASVQTLQARLP